MVVNIDNICNKIYSIGGENKIYGTETGICRITGNLAVGLLFHNWVRKTFNDYDSIKPGTIISNEALFCFDESSDILKNKLDKERPQRFRTYSHIISKGVWYALTKGNKEEIFNLIVNGAEHVILTETGQKHILFKHKLGLWQLDDLFVSPNIGLLKKIHFNMCELLAYQFSQKEVVTGGYISNRIMKAGLSNWMKHENEIKEFRGSSIFDFASFMLFNEKNYLKDADKCTKKLEIKPSSVSDAQQKLF